MRERTSYFQQQRTGWSDRPAVRLVGLSEHGRDYAVTFSPPVNGGLIVGPELLRDFDTFARLCWGYGLTLVGPTADRQWTRHVNRLLDPQPTPFQRCRKRMRRFLLLCKQGRAGMLRSVFQAQRAGERLSSLGACVSFTDSAHGPPARNNS